MKTPTTAPVKKVQEPRMDCTQAIYSLSALNIMEKATGLRLTKPPATIKPIAAVDAE